MRIRITILLAISLMLLVPFTGQCQILSGELDNFHKILSNMNSEMSKWTDDMLAVIQGIAAIGALFYIGVRVWKHLAAAEPIDFFPLFRPFLITILISLYPSMLDVMNGVLSPTIIVTKELVKNSNSSVSVLLENRRKAITDSKEWQDLTGGIGTSDEAWEKYQQQDDGGGKMSLGKAMTFALSIANNVQTYLIKLFLSYVLQVLYFAATLCIEAMSTFNLVILSLLGPFVLCLSIFDGFQHILPIWIARYVNIYLWVPIANLLGAMISKIQEGLLAIDISQMQQGQLSYFGQTDLMYLVFLVIAIIGYFCIPSIANYVVHASGANTIVSKTNAIVMASANMASVGAASAASSSAGSMSASTYGNDNYSSSMASAANSEPYHQEGGYNYNKLSGGKS